MYGCLHVRFLIKALVYPSGHDPQLGGISEYAIFMP